MPTLAVAIQQLAQFSEHDNVSSIVFNLRGYHRVALGKSRLFDDDIQTTIQETLRDRLKSIASDIDKDNIQVDELSLSDAAYNTLLALAEFRPINTVDTITTIEIPPAKRVFGSIQ